MEIFRSLQSPKSRKTVEDELELQEISNRLIYVKFLGPFQSLSECKNDFYLVDVFWDVIISQFFFFSLSLFFVGFHRDFYLVDTPDCNKSAKSPI